MSNAQNDEIMERYRELLSEYEVGRDEIEYKFLTTILRQLEDGVEHDDIQSVKTAIIAIKDRKDYLFNRGMI